VNAYLDETSEALIERGAYVDKYIGDAVMAVFGAPKPLADAPGAACSGALATLRVIEGLNARHAAAVGTTLAVRVGINTGLMTFGSLGSARKKNYTVLGDAVNLASRLEAANKEFGTNILLGDATARRLGAEFATRPLTRLRVKGKQEAIEVHELVGETALLNEADRAFLAAYREGYARHLAREFVLAATHLDRALALRPGDVTTAAHLADARNFIANAPPSDWQPLLKLTSK
jgi:adenylate cyclase